MWAVINRRDKEVDYYLVLEIVESLPEVFLNNEIIMKGYIEIKTNEEVNVNDLISKDGTKIIKHVEEEVE